MNIKLRNARKATGLTQSEIAEQLGYKSKSAYSMIETGRNKPRLSIALKIAVIVDERVEDLFQEIISTTTEKEDAYTNDSYKKIEY
jgi:putative transcriptional regulator